MIIKSKTLFNYCRNILLIFIHKSKKETWILIKNINILIIINMKYNYLRPIILVFLIHLNYIFLKLYFNIEHQLK